MMLTINAIMASSFREKRNAYEAKLWPGKNMVSIAVVVCPCRVWLMWFGRLVRRPITASEVDWVIRGKIYIYIFVWFYMSDGWTEDIFNYSFFMFNISARILAILLNLENMPKQSNQPLQEILIMFAASPSRIIKPCSGADGRRQIGELATISALIFAEFASVFLNF